MGLGFWVFWALSVVCAGGLGFGVLYVMVLGFGFWVLGFWGLGFDVLGFRRFRVSCETECGAATIAIYFFLEGLGFRV